MGVLWEQVGAGASANLPLPPQVAWVWSFTPVPLGLATIKCEPNRCAEDEDSRWVGKHHPSIIRRHHLALPRPHPQPCLSPIVCLFILSTTICCSLIMLRFIQPGHQLMALQLPGGRHWAPGRESKTSTCSPRAPTQCGFGHCPSPLPASLAVVCLLFPSLFCILLSLFFPRPSWLQHSPPHSLSAPHLHSSCSFSHSFSPVDFPQAHPFCGASLGPGAADSR